MALRSVRIDHYALKIRLLSRPAKSGGRPYLVCGVWVHIQTTAPCASQVHGRARGIIFDGKRPEAALPAFSCAISMAQRAAGAWPWRQPMQTLRRYRVRSPMAKFSPATTASGAPARRRWFAPRIPFSVRASHLLTGTVAVGLMGAATLANPSILPQSLLARATGSSANDAAAAQTQKPDADAPRAMANDASAAASPASHGKSTPQQIVVNTLPQNVPVAKRVEPMVAPVRRVIPKPVAPAPVVAQPSPAAPAGTAVSETGPGPQMAAAPVPAVAPSPTAAEPAITPPIPVPATRPSQLAATAAPAPEPAALTAATNPIAPVDTAAKSTKPTASARAKPATPAVKIAGRAALPKPLGLGAPKAPTSPSKTATPKIPKVISCLAGETYQPKTKTCAKPASTARNLPKLKIAPPKSI